LKAVRRKTSKSNSLQIRNLYSGCPERIRDRQMIRIRLAHWTSYSQEWTPHIFTSSDD